MNEHTRDDTTVTEVPERSRFEITVGGQLAGFAAYRLLPARITFTHTEIDQTLQGQGLAAVLVRAALDTAQTRGLHVTPQCSYVADYIRGHPEYVELVDSSYRGQVS